MTLDGSRQRVAPTSGEAKKNRALSRGLEFLRVGLEVHLGKLLNSFLLTLFFSRSSRALVHPLSRHSYPECRARVFSRHLLADKYILHFDNSRID